MKQGRVTLNRSVRHKGNNRFKQVLMAFVLLSISLFSAFTPKGLSAEKAVSLATTQWEPYVGENLQEYGFTSEIIKAAFNRMGYHVRLSFMPPKRVMMMVEAGEFDAGYPAYYSDDRAELFDYSAPFAEGAVGFYKRKDTGIRYKTLRDLAPFKIGTCLGFAYPKAFAEAGYLKKETAGNEVLNLRKLMNKRIDLFITDRAAAQAAISRSVPEARDVLEFMDPPLEVRKLHLIFGKQGGNKQKRKDFNTGLQRIMEDGTLGKILKKHGMLEEMERRK
jgi:polar amino acid transport system substrate-binding protein